MKLSPLVLVLHNIRSSYNVGSIFRTADAAGVNKIILSGYTPYPEIKKDPRPPYVRKKANKDIAKTALGAQICVPFEYTKSIEDVIPKLRREKYKVYALELDKKAKNIFKFANSRVRGNDARVALILGNEVSGIESHILKQADGLLEIPMLGKKESLNVSVAAGIAVYAIRSKQT